MQALARTAYTFGYIDALTDAGPLSQAEADRLQAAAAQRRDKRLAELGEEPVTRH